MQAEGIADQGSTQQVYRVSLPLRCFSLPSAAAESLQHSMTGRETSRLFSYEKVLELEPARASIQGSS